MNYRSVFKLLAYIVLFVALLMVLPTILSIYYGETVALFGFLVTLTVMVLLSLVTILILSRWKEKIIIGPKESYLFVTLATVPKQGLSIVCRLLF